MIERVFAWAVAQRYLCLQDLPGCSADQPDNFASSGFWDESPIWERP